MTIDVLVIGGSGFIGGRMVQSALKNGLSAACTTLSRPAPPAVPACIVDVFDSSALIACLERYRPRAVIYCALSWDLASQEAQMRVSAGGVSAVIHAMHLAGLDSRLVYISTNAVFSGRHGPYAETDEPDPENRSDAYRYYGLARRAGEQIALGQWPSALVVRTANVDGRDAWGTLNPRLRNLIDPLLAGRPLPRYVDRVISPTLVDNLASALVEVSLPSFSPPQGAVLHISGREPISDFNFARRLAGFLKCDPALVSEDHYLPPGESGIYSIGLDVTFTQSLLQTRLLTIDQMLESILGKVDDSNN